MKCAFQLSGESITKQQNNGAAAAKSVGAILAAIAASAINAIEIISVIALVGSRAESLAESPARVLPAPVLSAPAFCARALPPASLATAPRNDWLPAYSRSK